MTCRINKIVSILCLMAALFSAAFLPVSGHGETLRFVFLADSRGEHLDDPINKPVLTAIIAKIGRLSPKPAFVVFGGDMCYRGYIGDRYIFQDWKDLFAPLTSTGIALYTAVGNHELYHEHSDWGYFKDNQEAFQRVFSENPDNGPPGYERLVYSFTSPGGDAFFAVLDPYYLTTAIEHLSLCGTIDAPQLNWLAAQVAQTKASHKFLFIHTPYYYVTGSTIPDATYTNLWTILDNNRFVFYACGHSHLFSRKTIDSSIAPKPQLTPSIQWKNDVVQLLNGTCGAGVDTGEPTVDRGLWHVFNASDTYYFSVADIKDSQVTVTSHSYNHATKEFSIIDVFSNQYDLPGVNLLLTD